MGGKVVSFVRDGRGNFSMMLAILVLPIIGAVGLAIDYAQLSRVRADLYNAADAAVLGSISHQSRAMQDALTMDGDGPIDDGVKDAKDLFQGYIFANGDFTIDKTEAQVSKSGPALQAKLSFSAQVPLTFMRVLGRDTATIQGESSANMGIAPFVDFYLLLDNSPSMGVGALQKDVDKMVANTPDQCAFACHDLSNANNYYNLAKKIGVTMRIDVVRQATQQLTDTAESLRVYPNQYRMGVYTFGEAATDMRLTQLISPSFSLDKVKQAAGGIDLMTIPKQNYNNDQTTDYDSVFSGVDKLVGKAGDGSSPGQSQKVVFFVSDGVGDAYKPDRCTKKTTGGRCQEPIDTRVCTSLKERGVKVAVLYTTYLPLPTNPWYNTWIKPFQAEIPARMRDCASPGLFFEVGPNEGIAEAMTVLFRKVVVNLRLTT
jgi:hypothetical protein